MEVEIIRALLGLGILALFSFFIFFDYPKKSAKILPEPPTPGGKGAKVISMKEFVEARARKLKEAA